MTVSRCKFGGAISRALLAGTVALTTAGMTSVVSADSGKEWTIYGGDYANTRYTRSTRSTPAMSRT